MSSGENGAARPTRDPRPILRQATLILPKTGQRVKRKITLYERDSGNGAESNESTEESLSDGPDEGRGPAKTVLRTLRKKAVRWSRDARQFVSSDTGMGVLKCSLAYLLGSMATFVPAIAAILGQQDGKHMVATITVYFHPARSQGSMFEAVLLAIVAFSYAAIVSFSSMAVSVLFGRTFDLIVVGHIIVLIFFCGGSLGLIGWTKQRLGSPLVNISCSLASLAIITVLTKEGSVQASKFSDDKVTQVMLMVIMGVIATTTVSFLVQPISARKELRVCLIDVTDRFGDMLSLITRSFLTGSEEDIDQWSYPDASAPYQKTLRSLDKNLREAKFEHYFWGTESEYMMEAKLVQTMQRLAQNIGGLRSAAATQFGLLSQGPAGGGASPVLTRKSSVDARLTHSVLTALASSPPDNYGMLTAIDEVTDEDTWQDDRIETSIHTSHLPTAQAPTQIFERFIMHLGPSMKSLAYTMKQILDDLPYGPAPDFHISVNPRFRLSLTEALDLYHVSRKEALNLLYKQKELNAARPMEVEADFEEVAASCGHFSFCLQNFGEELKEYLEILDDLKLESERNPLGRSWNWLKFWRDTRRTHSTDQRHDSEQAILLNGNEVPDGVTLSINHDEPMQRLSKPTNRAEIPRTQSESFRRLWQVVRFLRRDDVKYAIKVGLGAIMFALPSFLVSTRPFYQRWRGEWGLLSYMLVCSMTIGASNTTGLARFLGTCLGAVCAIASWTITNGNAFALAFCGWLMSLWTAFLIVAKGKGPMGRFIMLTYNLSVLYAYSLSVKDENDDEDEGGVDPIISDIVLHRVVAVLTGCLWGLVVTRFVWPISARKKFKSGLSLLWLRMGLIWKRDPLAMLREGESADAYMSLGEEFELHKFTSYLEDLRNAAASEFDLKGPFPSSIYSEVLQGTNRILDAFHAMNVVILRYSKVSKGQAEILQWTAGERWHLSSRINHLFQVLASSMKLEFPLSDNLPKTDHARDTLLAKVFTYRKQDNVAAGTNDDDFALLYAYALVTGQLANEIETLGQALEKLFGVLDKDYFTLL